MEVTDIRFLEELGEAVDRLTTSGEPSLNSDLLKKLKSICKKSDVYVKHTYYLVMTQLKKCHAEIRLSSFQIINELFFRSHVFRELLLADFGLFLELTVETDHNQPLPPPKSAANTLKGKVLEAIECWFQKFGTHYKKLHLGYCYLKRTKKVEFNAASTRSQAERRQTEERERRRKNLINGQIIRVESEMSEMVDEMRLCATEMENCFKLLLPHPNDYHELYGGEEAACSSNSNSACNKRTYCQNSQRIADSQIENIPVESHVASDANHIKISEYSDLEQMNDEGLRNSTNQQLLSVHGLATRSYELSIKLNIEGPDIKETADNSILVNTLKELHKEVAHKHLPQINKWLSVLSKGEDMQCKIQQLIDLKRELESAKNKFLELKITPMTLHDTTCDSPKHRQTSPVGSNGNSDNEDGSDDSTEFEDVPEKEGLELVIPPNKRADYGLEPLPTVGQTLTDSSCQDTVKSTEFLKQFGSNLGDLGDPTSRTTALFHMKHKLSSNENSSTIPGNTEKVTDERKKKLLQKAPFVPYDMDLYFWDDPSAQVPKMIKTYLDNHWCSKEHEGEYLLGDEKDVRPTRIMTFAGNFEPVKWSCRAPLPSGKLCPRQDRVKCPFHGKIIARDETGAAANPYDDDASTSVQEAGTATENNPTPEWEEVQRDIEAAIGVDLGGSKKRVHKSVSKRSSKKKELAEKRSSLTNLKKKNNTSRSRIEKVVLNKAAMRRVADEMDAIATRRCQNKFGNQFNYSLSK